MATELLETTASALAGAAGDGVAPNLEADLIDLVVWFDRCMNRLAGARSVAVDLARRQSENALDAQSDPMMARRAFTAEIAAALRISERAAENLIGVSTALGASLPATQQALGSGDISYRHAQIMVDHSAGLSADEIAQLERRVIETATVTSAPRFDSFVRRTRERLSPESIEARHVAAVDRRTVVLDEARDGMAWISAHLPAPQAHAIFDRLTSAGLAMGRGSAGRAPDGERDARTLAQRRADAFAAVLLAANPEGPNAAEGSDHGDESVTPGAAPVDDAYEFARWFRGITARVFVTVPALSLLGRSDEPANLEGYGPIDPHTARILAGRARSFTRILTHPETGAVLSVGRERYSVPKDLRAWLRVRDGTCRFVGCGQRAERCDIDHTIEWQHGGMTAHDNLAHLCRRHHMLKGSGRWKVRQSGCGDGELTWTSPTGRDYTTHPETRFEPENTVRPQNSVGGE
jgi:hypothetical protein